MQYPHFHLFKRIQHCWYCPMSIIPAEVKFEVFKIMKIFLLCLTSMKLSAAQFSYRIFQRRGKEKGKFRFFAVANNSNFWDVEIGESVLSQVFLPDIVMLVGQPGQERDVQRNHLCRYLDSYDYLGLLERPIPKQCRNSPAPVRLKKNFLHH